MHKVSLGGEILSSKLGSSHRNSCISAYWKSPQDDQPELRIGHIQYMLKHKATIVDEIVEHVITFVHWFKKHPQQMYFGSSAHVVRNDFETGSTICSIPIQRFNARMCFGDITINPTAENAIPISLLSCLCIVAGVTINFCNPLPVYIINTSCCLAFL